MTPYSPVANEYYDPAHHPTCANFNDLSRCFLNPRIRALASVSGRVLEVGSGRSVAAPVIAGLRSQLDELTLLDSSTAMLDHSRQWERQGAHLHLADARDTGLPSKSFELLVASLGDPYNVDDFWLEAHRILQNNGTCLFTTPAPEWADRFRSTLQRSEAEFILADGSKIFMPSYVPSLENQIEMIERAGFQLEEIRPYFATDISGPISPKLMPLGESTAGIPVIRGFVACRLD